MKFKSLTIALCTLGLVALVPLVKMATAQPEPVSLEEKIGQWQAEERAQSAICDRISQEEANNNFEGNDFFDFFEGLNLTDEQNSTYDALMAQADAKRTEVFENTVSIVNPTASLSFSSSANPDSIPEDIQAAIQAALNENPTVDQKEALNREFGQYGEFSGSYIVRTTPEQEQQRSQINENFYAQVQNIMTPEQLPRYRENLAVILRMEGCGSWVPVSADQDLGQVLVGLTSPMGRVVDTISELLQ